MVLRDNSTYRYIHIYLYVCSAPFPRTTFWAKNCLSNGAIGKGQIPSISMNIGNGTIVDTNLRMTLILTDGISSGTNINIYELVLESNTSSNMHIDIHTNINIGIIIKYQHKYD